MLQMLCLSVPAGVEKKIQIFCKSKNLHLFNHRHEDLDKILQCMICPQSSVSSRGFCWAPTRHALCIFQDEVETDNMMWIFM